MPSRVKCVRPLRGVGASKQNVTSANLAHCDVHFDGVCWPAPALQSFQPHADVQSIAINGVAQEKQKTADFIQLHCCTVGPSFVHHVTQQLQSTRAFIPVKLG